MKTTFSSLSFKFQCGALRPRESNSKLKTQNLKLPSSAFTMIEIMIVIAIIGIVLTLGIPSMFKTMHKDSIRKAVSDVLEVCQQARAQAIVRGTLVELRIRPLTGEFLVVPVSETDTNLLAVNAQGQAMSAGVAAAPAAPTFKAQLSNRIVIELLDVNFLELKDEEDVRVRFQPNGTSDEFTIVLRSGANEWRKISLDVVTGLADFEVIR